MRLAVRMTLGVALSAAVLFGGAGALQLRQEEADLRSVARSEALLLGRALQTSLKNALRDRQLEDVTETLDALERVDPSVSIFVFDEEGKVVGVSSGSILTADIYTVSARARTTTDAIVEVESATEHPVLTLGRRLREEAPSEASTIVLQKPLTELRRDLSATRRDIVIAVVFFVLAVAGLTWALSRRYVGQPLERLIANMRHVRAGGLQVSFSGDDRDEVGATHREFYELVTALEQTRRRADEELEARQRLERGLQDADKLITLGQLSAVLAHEIGSPLQILEGRARSLLKAPDIPSVERVVPLIVEQTERITRIVRQLLEITRKRSPVRAHVSLTKATRSVVDLLEIEARRRNLRLVLRASGDAIVFADADQLQQIVLNLVRNAMHAAPAGSEVDIIIRDTDDADNLAREGEGSAATAMVILEVRDQGPGVPDAIAEKLFEPFFTTRSTSGGTGLGLSVVQSIVREHNGDVAFVQQTVGALIRVRLPKRENQ